MKSIIRVLFVGLFIAIATQTNADPGDPGNLGPTPGPAAVPVDGGASLLLAAGGSYAIKKFKERRKAKKQ